ncbi:MAG: Fis family transcriptional regulator [Sphingobacteriia bacterium]|nr:Fis family transcriptional regulator [Sphingobacteriia bacterium]NCC38784.1 Fis family transcriptional regulator [Gammaproteobacteria bacterium]
MIEASGRVTAIDGRFAEVQTERRSPCGGCAARGGCGTSLLERVFSRVPPRVRAVNRIGARIGDPVVIGVSERGLLTAALAVYLVPILALILGALGGDLLAARFAGAGGDLAGLLGGLIGFALALSWLRRFSDRAASRREQGVQVIKRIDDAACMDSIETHARSVGMPGETAQAPHHRA